MSEQKRQGVGQSLGPGHLGMSRLGLNYEAEARAVIAGHSDIGLNLANQSDHCEAGGGRD
jgi:hypothetical protein